jgi:hypothetical protein
MSRFMAALQERHAAELAERRIGGLETGHASDP